MHESESNGNGESIINGLPNICYSNDAISRDVLLTEQPNLYVEHNQNYFDGIHATFATMLHMHQPMVPAGGEDLKTAGLIGNLQYMMEHQHIGDNHNAPVFLECYKRMGDFIPQLVEEGHHPRIMLEYSGCLLFGLQQMNAQDVLENLKRITSDSKYHRNVEWIGAPWGHAVAPSTPVQDFRHHIRAWQHHFMTLFGLDALRRVRGFSPSEMALPNHPDVAFEFVKTLKDCGYQWVVIQEHTIEAYDDGQPIRKPHVPHRLVAVNSSGESVSIIAIIKTQGSDSKLVGQMQPYYEAKSSSVQTLAGKSIPPLVTQIADGENGGVMMNEFPSKYLSVMREASGTSVCPMNVTEYLEHLMSLGITEDDFPRVRPIMQGQIFAQLPPNYTSQDVQQTIKSLQAQNPGFHMDGGSWTNDLSWVRGYENVLGPMEKLSAAFESRVIKSGCKGSEKKYQNALYHLLCAQTSCYRYWGQGTWTDYGLEIIRRANEIIKYDFRGPEESC